VEHFGSDCFNKVIYGFTEIVKDKHVYRADTKYRKKGCWKDNVIISWTKSDQSAETSEMTDETDQYLVPAEIQIFFQFEDDPTMYSLVHSCHYRHEKSSVLSYMWMKEYRGVPVSSFPTYKTNQEVNVSDKDPIFRVVQCKSIISHCLLLPFKPDTCFMLEVIHPSKWADEFLEIP